MLKVIYVLFVFLTGPDGKPILVPAPTPDMKTCMEVKQRIIMNERVLSTACVRVDMQEVDSV